ncbi:MAG: hypothetical protein V4710_13345, partial [Verrucomicrobiota bacterium]
MNAPYRAFSAYSRRDFLWNLGGGIGGIALAQLLGGEATGAELLTPRPEFNGGLHHPAVGVGGRAIAR